MKFRKLVFECGIIAASAVIISGSSAVSVSAAETATETADTGSEQEETESRDSEEKDDASDSDVQEVEGDITIEETSAEEVSDAGEEETAEEEISGWDNQLLVIVGEDSSLNVREEASTDSEVVGKMYRGSAAEIVEKGDEWTKIISGDVEGYVKNEYCVFAEEAAAKAAEICDTAATVKTDGVRLRSDASTDSTIYRVMSEGDSLTAAETDGETNSDWVAVEYGNTVAYISSDYVDVELEVGEAVSMEEIYEQQAAEEAKKAAEAAAEASSDSGTSSSSGTAVSASSDDTTLLAALIQCEAGGESYEGQLAVGAVVMNRVKSGSFPNSISGVIYQSGQFSPASSGKLSRVLSSGSISSSCYKAAQAAIAGEDNTGGAKYFHAGSGSGTVIGNQVFY